MKRVDGVVFWILYNSLLSLLRRVIYSEEVAWEGIQKVLCTGPHGTEVLLVGLRSGPEWR